MVLEQLGAKCKGETDPLEYRIKFENKRQNGTEFQEIHTDG